MKKAIALVRSPKPGKRTNFAYVIDLGEHESWVEAKDALESVIARKSFPEVGAIVNGNVKKMIEKGLKVKSMYPLLEWEKR